MHGAKVKLLFNCTTISAINKGTVLHNSIFNMDRNFFSSPEYINY